MEKLKMKKRDTEGILPPLTWVFFVLSVESVQGIRSISSLLTICPSTGRHSKRREGEERNKPKLSKVILVCLFFHMACRLLSLRPPLGYSLSFRICNRLTLCAKETNPILSLILCLYSRWAG